MPKVQLISPSEAFEIGDADCGFTIRRIGQDTILEVRKRHTRWVESAESPAGTPYKVPETDETEVEKDLLDYVLMDWRGVEGPDGEEAPCTRETKQALPTSIKLQIIEAAKAVNRRGDLAGELKNWPRPSGTPGPAGPTSGGSAPRASKRSGPTAS